MKSFLYDGPSQCLNKIVLIMGVKDVDIDANRIFILLFYEMKSVLNKPSFPYFSWRNKRYIASILQMSNQIFTLYYTVTKIVRTLITLINKGIFQLVRRLFCHNCHFTFGVTLLVLYFQCDAKVVIILQTSKLF